MSGTGHRPSNLVEADRALKDFVLQAVPALVRFFHRRLLRQCLVFASPGAPAYHLLFKKVEPILER